MNNGHFVFNFLRNRYKNKENKFLRSFHYENSKELGHLHKQGNFFSPTEKGRGRTFLNVLVLSVILFQLPVPPVT